MSIQRLTYAEDGECRWVTIGGGKDDEGNPKGGSKVCIGKGGKITKGPSGVEGKDIDTLDKDVKPGSKGGPPEKPKKGKPTELRDMSTKELQEKAVKTAPSSIEGKRIHNELSARGIEFNSIARASTEDLKGLGKTVLPSSPDGRRIEEELRSRGVEFNAIREASTSELRKMEQDAEAGSIDETRIQDELEARGVQKPTTITPPTNTARNRAERMKAAEEAARTRPADQWGTAEQPFFRPGANPTVDMVLTRQGEGGEQEVLMIKRRTGEGVAESGKWALPGGFVDSTAKKGEFWDDGETESPEDAAFRELTEETGLDAATLREKVREVGKFDAHGRDPRDNDEAWSESTAFGLDVTDMAGSGNVAGLDDAEAAEWVPVSQLEALDMAFDHRDILDAAGVESGQNESRRREIQSAAFQTRKQLQDLFGRMGGRAVDQFAGRIVGDQESDVLEEVARVVTPRSRIGRVVNRELKQRREMEKRQQRHSIQVMTYAKCKKGETAAQTGCTPAEGESGAPAAQSPEAAVQSIRGLPKAEKAELIQALKGESGTDPKGFAAFLISRGVVKNKQGQETLAKIASGEISAETPQPEAAPEAPASSTKTAADAINRAAQQAGSPWPSTDQITAQMGGDPVAAASAVAELVKTPGAVQLGQWNRNLAELKEHPAADSAFMLARDGGPPIVGFEAISQELSRPTRTRTGDKVIAFVRLNPMQKRSVAARRYGEGEPCKQGEAAAKTGCIPAGKEAGGRQPSRSFRR